MRARATSPQTHEAERAIQDEARLCLSALSLIGNTLARLMERTKALPEFRACDKANAGRDWRNAPDTLAWVLEGHIFEAAEHIKGAVSDLRSGAELTPASVRRYSAQRLRAWQRADQQRARREALRAKHVDVLAKRQAFEAAKEAAEDAELTRLAQLGQKGGLPAPEVRRLLAILLSKVTRLRSGFGGSR